MTYLEALQIRDELDRTVDNASKRLNAYPKGAMGLTPDSVKATPEWQADSKKFNACMKLAQNFNRMFVKQFKKEWKATLLERRNAKAFN